MANTYVKIGSTVTVGVGGQASITFSSIPSTYTDLLLVASLKSVTTGGNWMDIQLRPNGSSTGLTQRSVYGYSGTSVASNTDANPTGGFAVQNNTASNFSSTNIYIPNYAGSTNKSWSLETVVEDNGNSNILWLGADLWSNTAAITSLTLTTLTNNLAQYSTASLYGILKS